MQGDFRRDGAAAFGHLPVGEDGDRSGAVENGEHRVGLQEQAFACGGDAALFKGEGQGQDGLCRAVFVVQQEAPLQTEREGAFGDLPFPEDAQRGIGMDEVAQANGHRAAAEVEFGLLGRLEQKGLVEAEAHGDAARRLEFAEHAVVRSEFHTAFEAVHGAEVDAVDKESTGEIG